MGNIHTLIFSKNRALQLTASLESFFFYTGGSTTVTVLTPSCEQYAGVAEKNPNVLWMDEQACGGFGLALKEFVSAIPDDDLILFQVDDLIWKLPFHLLITYAINQPELSPVGAFSLRLGTNVKPYNPAWNLTDDKMYSIFDWRNKPGDFGYPGDVSSSVYRASVVKELLSDHYSKIRLPNDLESVLNRGFHEKHEKYPFIMMMNGNSYNIAVDVNRTQNLYQNKINGTDEHTVEEFQKLYEQGKRIVWSKYFGIQNDSFFYGARDLVIR